MARKPSSGKPPRKPPRARSATASDHLDPSRRNRAKGGARPTGKPGRKTAAPPTGRPAGGRGGAPRTPAAERPAPSADARPRDGRSASGSRADPERRHGRTAPSRAKGLWLYGRHAVEAALANPRRSCHRLIGVAEALARLEARARRAGVEVQEIERDEIERRLGPDALHQGLALSVAPLPRLDLGRTCRPEPGTRNLVLLLDQVQDPHNLGAILRSAAAFEARAVIVPDRNSAPLGGVAAKAASGALDLVPVVEVTNLARALQELAELGYWRVALDGDADQTVDSVPDTPNLALVLGAEGTGVRRLVAERCDLRVRLPIAPAMESLNVSVACGIALYALSRRGSSDST